MDYCGGGGGGGGGKGYVGPLSNYWGGGEAGQSGPPLPTPMLSCFPCMCTHPIKNSFHAIT